MASAFKTGELCDSRAIGEMQPDNDDSISGKLFSASVSSHCKSLGLFHVLESPQRSLYAMFSVAFTVVAVSY